MMESMKYTALYISDSMSGKGDRASRGMPKNERNHRKIPGNYRGYRKVVFGPFEQSQILSVCVLCLLFLSAFAVLLYQSLQRDMNPTVSSSEVHHTIARESRSTVHAPIYINGNADFASQAANEGWVGDGSQDNPYIIEGYEIDAKGTKYCISIENTTVWFVIRNCTVWNATVSYSDPFGTGIYLKNVQHATIENNNCSGNYYYGIYLESSSDNNITNNNCSGSSNFGIGLKYSSNNTITNNTCSGNSYGIYLWYSSNSNITNNTCSDNSYIGIGMWYLDNNNIAKNTCSNNSEEGLRLVYCSGISIKDNIWLNNKVGIFLWNTSYTVLVNNTFLKNGIRIIGDSLEHWNTHLIDTTNTVNGKPVYYYKNQSGGTVPADVGQVILANCTNMVVSGLTIENASTGIILGYSWYLTITNNSCSGNSHYGIYIAHSGWNNITYNNCSGNGDGIHLCTSYRTIIANNNCSLNINGIYLEDSGNNNITYNECCNNSIDGIMAYYSSRGNTITHNNCSGNSNGIELYFFSTYNKITNNTCSANLDGIFLGFEADNNNITNNNCSGNWYKGIFLVQSSNNTLTNNNCSSSSSLDPGDGRGIELLDSCNNNIITNNTCCYNPWDGILVSFSSNNNIFTHNNCSFNSCGIRVSDSHTNYITYNEFWYNIYYAISINFMYGSSATGNIIHHNNFWYNNGGSKWVNGKSQASDEDGRNYWHDGNTKEGNYWSNWDGQNWGKYGAYPIDGNGRSSDWYPLLEPVGTSTVPSAPRNLTAIAGNANITLSWEPPVDDGGMAVTNYTIYYGTNSGNYTMNMTVGNITCYTITGLTNGQRYYFAVSAINAVGESAKSNEVSAMPCTLPSAPRNLTAVAGNRNVTLTWEPPADNGGMSVTNYTVYYGTSPGNYTNNITLGNITNYTITGLINGQRYYFAVSAINAVGESPKSNEVFAMPCTVPSAPQNLTAVAGNGNVTLTWQPPADDGGSPITGYKIYYGTSAGNYTTNITVGNITSYTITNLTNGQKYYFAVSAINAVGEGPKSNEASATPTAEQQHGKTPGFDVLVGICAIAVSMVVMAIWRKKSR